MKKILSFIAVATLAFSFSAAANAATKKYTGVASPSVGTKQPMKNNYGKGMQAHWGPGCKMSGSC